MNTYNALEVANYIVWRAENSGKEITNLKLQKILYYLQSYNLLKHNKPLFKDVIEKWKLGPVVPNVYQEYKHFGAKRIDKVPDMVSFDFEKGITIQQYNVEESSITKDDKKELEPIIDRLLEFDGFELVELTHKHPMWFNDRERIESGYRNIAYDNKEIREFFMKHKEERIWEKK
ncbi:type II toxin-antitoxin system antitoxin SocA domain-containing protein [Bacillus sp. FSL W8-0223]|uniref:Panacea domain-containing protein n=1 Tax=Bacillus sp. FSL W8-0223 TaxID=2954595 RepID=UPI0030F87E9E